MSLGGAKIGGIGSERPGFYPKFPDPREHRSGDLCYSAAFSGDFLIQVGVRALAAQPADALRIESTALFGCGGFVW